MFEDDEDIDYFESGFNTWFNSVEFDLPEELTSNSKDHAIDLLIFYRVYCSIIGPLTLGVYQLMLKQYPLLQDEIRPRVVEHIRNNANDTASLFLIALFRLVYGQKSGVNVREKYINFDNYLKSYARPPQPMIMGDEYRYAAIDLTDEEWEQRKKEINIENQEEFDEENIPRVEFIDRLQSIVMSRYSELENLNPDEWIIYALILHNEYRKYQDRCWLIDSFIAYDLPESDLNLPSYDLEKKIIALGEEIMAEHMRKQKEQQKNEN